MSREFGDIEDEILKLTEGKPKDRAFMLKQLEKFRHFLFLMRAGGIHGENFLGVPE